MSDKETSSVEDTEARSAMKLALEALTATMSTHGFREYIEEAQDKAIKALEEALDKQEQRSVSEHTGEPVGTAGELFTNAALERLDFKPSTKIYTTPQQSSTIVRKPLTVEEIAKLDCYDHLKFARAIEAAHGIKE
jgi:hypothetical protein